MTETYRIADIAVRIESLHKRVHRLCEAYRENDASPVFCVRITEADLALERELSERNREKDERPSSGNSDSYLEELAVYRKIAEKMPSFDTVLMHGSCIAMDGEGYLFAAKSGTGKSTHARLWRERFGDRVIMINDDKPLIRVSENGPVVFGTPWAGKHHLNTNTSVPLKAICFLERAEQNAAHRITFAEAYPMLLQQIYRPADSAAMKKTLALIDRLGASVDLWRLECNMEPEAAQAAYNAMKGSAENP